MPLTTGTGQRNRARANCSPSKTLRSSRLPPPWRAQQLQSRGFATGFELVEHRTDALFHIALHRDRHHPQIACWPALIGGARRSARAELGTLVRMAMQPGRCGSGRLRAGSSKPSLSSCCFTCSKRRSTVERLGRMSRACTLKLARAPQKFSLPTTRTPSPSLGRKLSRATVEAQATAWIEASPSLRLNQRWPFFKTV